MDALYAVLDADTPHRRRCISMKVQVVRQALQPIDLHSDPELPPTLLGLALMECRIAGIGLPGIIALVSQVYGKDLTVREMSPLEKMETEGRPQ